MSTWNERPENLSANELQAWALCQIADALLEGSEKIYDGVRDSTDDGNGNPTSRALDRLATALIDVGLVPTPTLDFIGGLQYIADRVGGNLERIADQLEKEKIHDD